MYQGGEQKLFYFQQEGIGELESIVETANCSVILSGLNLRA